jgi:hypothetical protein
MVIWNSIPLRNVEEVNNKSSIFKNSFKKFLFNQTFKHPKGARYPCTTGKLYEVSPNKIHDSKFRISISYGKLVPVRWFPAYICWCMIERETSRNRANRNLSAFSVTLRINDNSRCSSDCNRDNSGDSVILRNQTK